MQDKHAHETNELNAKLSSKEKEVMRLTKLTKRFNEEKEKYIS